MKKLRKPLAIFTGVLILVLSVISAFSAQEPPCVYLSVLGDSIASGYGLKDLESSYAAEVSKEKHYSLSNDAVDGHTTTDLLWVVCHDSVAREGLEKADLVAISIGGNDILQLLLNSNTTALLDILSNGAQSQYVKNAVSVATEKLLFSCMEIRSLNPDVPIILQTQYNPLYAHEQYKQFAPLADKLAPAFADVLNYVSEELGNIYIADVYTAFDNYYKETGDYSVIQADGIHPSETGHDLIAQVILPIIDKLESEDIVPIAYETYYLLGDPDASGTVTISDATMIQKYIARIVIFKDRVVRMCADADEDGLVTIKDATAIQKHLAKLTTDSSIDTYIPYITE